MKIFFHFLILIFIVALTYSCDKTQDNEEPNPTPPPTVQVYYSYNDTSKVLFPEKDTITIKMADTFSVYVDISDTSKVLEYYITPNMPSSFNKGNYKYRISSSKSGIHEITVLIVWGPAEKTAAESKNDDYLYCKTFYYTIPTTDYFIYSLEDPVYSIDVEDDDLKNRISTELDEKYKQLWRPLELTGDSITGGTYLLKTPTEATGAGTFTTTNILDIKDLTFSHNNTTFRYSLTSTSEKIEKLFSQDLTNEFQTEYPDQTINKVTLSFNGICKKE